MLIRPHFVQARPDASGLARRQWTSLKIVSRFVAAMLLLLATSASAQSLVCGDCNQDASVDILDALRAAQIDIGLVVPTPLQLLTCDVIGHGTVSVLDALVLGQHAAGLGVSFGCSSPPPSSSSPDVLDLVVPGSTATGGVASGDVTIDIFVADLESDLIDLLLEYRTPGGLYQAASLAQAGFPWQGLPTSPAGIWHTIVWRSALDLPEGVGLVSLRASAFDPARGARVEVEVVLENLSVLSPVGEEWVQPTVGAAGGISVPTASFDHRAVVLGDGRVVITGGENQTSGVPLARTSIYDPVTHQIIQGADIPGSGRVGHLVHVIDRPGNAFDGWIVVAGGTNGVEYLDDVFVLDPDSLTWTIVPVQLQVTTGGWTLRGALAAGKGDPSPSAYVGATGTITTGPLAMHATPPGGNPEQLQTNVGLRIHIDPDGDGDLTDCFVEPIFYSYIRELDESCTVTHHPGLDGLLGTADDRLVVFGGVGLAVDKATGIIIPPFTSPPGDPVPPGCVLADAEIVDLSSGETAVVAATRLYDTYEYVSQAISSSPPSGDWDHLSMIQRYNHDAVVLEDGRILVAGGVDAWGDISSPGGSIAISPNFDLAVQVGMLEPLTSRTFTLSMDPTMPTVLDAWHVEIVPFPSGVLLDPTSPLVTGHINYAEMTLLGHGRYAGGNVLLAGGDDARTSGSSATSSFQLYDPATSSWRIVLDATGQTAMSMLRDRALHTLTSLPGGVVLAWSGSPGAGISSALPSFELFLP